MSHFPAAADERRKRACTWRSCSSAPSSVEPARAPLPLRGSGVSSGYAPVQLPTASAAGAPKTAASSTVRQPTPTPRIPCVFVPTGRIEGGRVRGNPQRPLVLLRARAVHIRVQGVTGRVLRSSLDCVVSAGEQCSARTSDNCLLRVQYGGSAGRGRKRGRTG